MLSRILTGLSLAALVLSVAAGLLPATPVQAHDTRPPFEFSFPQETSRTTFSNDWGSRRSGGRRHTATDLMAESKMVEVYAFADGIVTKINERPRPGRYISIDHGDGWATLYVHLNDDNPGTDDGEADWSLTLAPGIEEGAEVKAGQLIGWAGDSGNAEGNKPHTHFELSIGGHEINPYHLLVEAYERDHRAYLLRQRVVGDGVYEIT